MSKSGNFFYAPLLLLICHCYNDCVETRLIMIDKVSSSVKHNTPKGYTMQSKPSFTGLGDAAVKMIQMCEQQPMVNVSVLDLSTAIVPRSIIETYAGSKKTDADGNVHREPNFYAGMEAFRRESSGLVVNCLIPSFIVMGASSLLQKPIMGKNAGLTKVWANDESLKVVSKYLVDAEGKGSVKLENALKAFMHDLSGVDGNVTRSFMTSNGTDVLWGIKHVAKSTRLKHPSKLLKKGYNTIAKASNMTEHLKLKGRDGYLSKDLKAYLQDFVDVHKTFEKEGIKTAEQASNFVSKATKLVNAKSIAGLGVIIPLAISMQPINRWITRKTSGKKGAPIYNDFKDRKEEQELTPKQKRELLAQKFISIGSMVGVAGLSMFMDRPVWKNILQFKGLFPTMDQARIISTATFASRMAASEDKNELREATVRDIATFSSFYFLGDYVAKGIATLMEKFNKDVKLINTLKPRKEDANALQKFWHWAKHTTIKSSDELATVKDKRLRTWCQIGNIAFSLLSLGVFIPLYNRSKTNKKHAEELAKLNETQSSSQKTAAATTDFSTSFLKDNTAFKAFIRKEK